MTALKFNASTLLISALSFLMIFAYLPSEASSQVQLSTGETVYVSVYSNVYSGPKKVPVQLAAMLIIRNTDPKYPITILKADYYDDDGTMIERYIKKQFELKPLASTYFYIREYDKRGGPGAKFIVKWLSTTKVNQPIIEGIMLGLTSGQGLSFICPGQIIRDSSQIVD
jgi:Protein of unknown function (DUF3124)